MKRIEICGNIASGKTTLCQKLSEKGILPLYENFHENPFYKKFYENPRAYSFETEITFLLQHYHSIKTYKTESKYACDYSLLQDMAYADVNLKGIRHKIFHDIVSEIHNEIGFPSQIIHLSCPEEILLQRIIDRNRAVETVITIDYLKDLKKSILYRVKNISSKIKVININSHSIDFRSGIGKVEGYIQ